jgi:plastocyanin
MLRSICAFVLLAFACLVSPAFAGDADVGFQCCRYSPDSVRITPGGRVTWTGTSGATFAQHPLRFDDPTFGQEDSGPSAYRDFPTAGVYTWYCNIHGVNGGSMKGRVAVTNNHLPVASFTASATDVASGTEVTFDASGSSDADLAQSLNYSWDLDGNGADDAGQTSVSPSAVFTNTGTTPRSVTVRLTATDTNSDAVGPESSTTTKVITIAPAPAPAPGPAPSTGPADDTRPPLVHLTLAKSLTVATRLRVTFTTDEPATARATLKVGKRTARASQDFAAGKHAITVKLSKAIRRLLRHRRTVGLTLAVTDDAGNGTTLKRALKLKARQPSSRAGA